MEENELILNEASGVNAGDIPIPDGGELPTSADDARWNTIYKDLLNKNNLQYFTIVVDGFQRKEPIEGEPTKGFVKFTGQTDQSVGKKFLFWGGKTQENLKLSDVEIVEHEDEATLFRNEDSEAVIQALKSNKDLKSYTSIGRKKASNEAAQNINYANQLILKYFDVLAGEGKSSFIKPAMGVIETICRQRQKPLVGNSLFNIFKAITEANPAFRLNTSIVTTINNIIADRILSSNDIINPNNFLSSLMYNESLYTTEGHNRTEKDIEELFSLYEKAKALRSSEITIPGLRDYKVLQIAKQIILSAEDEEVFKAILNGTAGEDEKLTELGYKPEGVILTGKVRDIEEAQGLYNKIFETADRPEEESSRSAKYFLQLIQGSNVKTYDLKRVIEEEGNTEGRFENVDFVKDAFVRVVRTTADKASDKELGDLISTLKPDYFKGSELFIFEDGKLKVKTDSSNSVNIEVISTNSKGKTAYVLKEFIPTDVVVTTDTTPEEKVEEKPSEETTEEKPVDLNHLSNGKSIGDIIISREVFRSEYPSLTPKEKARIRSIVNPSWLPAA